MNNSQTKNFADLYNSWDSTQDITKMFGALSLNLNNLRLEEFSHPIHSSSFDGYSSIRTPTSIERRPSFTCIPKEGHQFINDVNVAVGGSSSLIDPSYLWSGGGGAKAGCDKDEETFSEPISPVANFNIHTPTSSLFESFSASTTPPASPGGRSSMFSGRDTNNNNSTLSNLLQFNNAPLSPYCDSIMNSIKNNSNGSGDDPQSARDSSGGSQEQQQQQQEQHQQQQQHSFGHSASDSPPVSLSGEKTGVITQNDALSNAIRRGREDSSPAPLEVVGIDEEEVVDDSDFFFRRLGGFRNIGWTLNHQVNQFEQDEYQALVYSLHTFDSFLSPWMLDEKDALKLALSKCYQAERGGHDEYESFDDVEVGANLKVISMSGNQQNEAESKLSTANNVASEETPNASETGREISTRANNQSDLKYQQKSGISRNSDMLPFSKNKKQQSDSNNNNDDDEIDNLNQLCIGMNNIKSNTKGHGSIVLIWTSYLPSTMSTDMILSIWSRLLPPEVQLLGLKKTPEPSQGVLIFKDLLSAINFIRAAKSKQLECFDILVAGDNRQSLSLPSTSEKSLLFNPLTGNAVGFGLVNVSPQHPTCVHTLRRLSQKDAVALGHKRTSTETLRLLLTHPEVSPVMSIPQAQAGGTYTLFRTTPLSQTPSHRRASIWCALCCSQSSDIPGAWKHLSRNPHEALRENRNNSLLEWLEEEHPALFATMAGDMNNEVSKFARGFEAGEKHAIEAGASGNFEPLKPFHKPKHSRYPASISHSGVWTPDKSGTSVQQILRGNSKGLNPEAPAFVPGVRNMSPFQKLPAETCQMGDHEKNAVMHSSDQHKRETAYRTRDWISRNCRDGSKTTPAKYYHNNAMNSQRSSFSSFPLNQQQQQQRGGLDPSSLLLQQLGGGTTKASPRNEALRSFLSKDKRHYQLGSTASFPNSQDEAAGDSWVPTRTDEIPRKNGVSILQQQYQSNSRRSH